MQKSEYEEFRRIPLFSEVTDAAFVSLMQAGVLRRFPTRMNLIEEGERPEFLHLVVEGSVQLFAGMGGEETTLLISQPATAFFLAAVVGDLPYLASARTLKLCRILMIPAETVRSAFNQDPAFARVVVREVAQGFRDILTELTRHKLRTSIERLADWLLRANEQLGQGGRFTMPCNKRTLASRLGMTPENLSRNLRLLSDYGVVTSGRNVTLAHPAALAAIGRPALQNE